MSILKKLIFFCVVLCVLGIQLRDVYAEGKPFLYQGRLDLGDAPANGVYDLVFSLFDTAQGSGALAGPITNSATVVSNGRFAVNLDFGAGPFTGTNYWLGISARPAGDGAFTETSPRRALRPSPYANHGQGRRISNVVAGGARQPGQN